MVENFKIPKNLIQKLKHSLKVITSISVSKNCILGTLKADVWIVMNDKAKSLQKCEDNSFYIAGPEIILNTQSSGPIF